MAYAGASGISGGISSGDLSGFSAGAGGSANASASAAGTGTVLDHPYLRRRDGIEPVSFPKPELEAVLGKTLGVPLFQEQAMRIAIECAGFTAAEADRLRRAVTGFRRYGDIEDFARQFNEGMVRRGFEPDFAERCFAQIRGFSTYGFPREPRCWSMPAHGSSAIILPPSAVRC